MNYYEARQVDANADRPDAGKWRYTCMNDGRVWPVGYCAQDCPGHDTPEEARQHQTEYVLNERLRLDGEMADQQLRCEADVPTGGVNISGLLTSPPTGTEKCGKFTSRFAEVDHHMIVLCDAHRTKETVAALFGGVGSSVSSW